MRFVIAVALAGCSFHGRGMQTGDDTPMPGHDADPTGDGASDGLIALDAPDDPMLGPPGGVAAPILFWIAAEDAVHDVDGAVSAWPDRGPGHHDLAIDATSKKPMLKRSHGAAVVKFESAHMTATGIFPTGTTTPQLAMFAVLRDDTSTDFDWVFYEGTIVGDRMSLSNSYSAAGRWDLDVPGSNRLSTTLPDASPILLTMAGNDSASVIGTGSEMAVWIDGKPATSLSPFDPYVGTGMPLELGDHVAANGTGDASHSPYDGVVGEILIVGSSLDETKAEQIDTYLALRYGLTLGHDYRSSAGTVVRQTVIFEDRIFGLAHDPAGHLDVRNATSAIGGDLLELHATTMPANPIAYAIGGDDNQQLTFDSNDVIRREWRFEVADWSEPVQFDIAGPTSNAMTKLPALPNGTMNLVIGTTIGLSQAITVPMTLGNDGRWKATTTLPGPEVYVRFTSS